MDFCLKLNPMFKKNRRAPERRMDNVITHLHDSVNQLHMHALLLKDIRTRFSKFYWRCRWEEVGAATAGIGATALSWTYGAGVVPMQLTGSLLASTILLTGGLTWYHGSQLAEYERQAKTVEELSVAFRRAYSRQISEGDEYTAAVWQRVRDSLLTAVEDVSSLSQLEIVTDTDLNRLQDILINDIPALRRMISPTHYGKDND